MQRFGDLDRIRGVTESLRLEGIPADPVTPVTGHYRVNQTLALRAMSGLSLNTPRVCDSATRVLS